MPENDYAGQIEEIASLTNSLRAALLRDDQAQADRVAPQLENRLREGNQYKRFFDEFVLSAAVNALTQYYGEADDELRAVENHLELVRAVHQCLWDVLDPDISIESLLYEKLNNEPQLST